MPLIICADKYKYKNQLLEGNLHDDDDDNNDDDDDYDDVDDDDDDDDDDDTGTLNAVIVKWSYRRAGRVLEQDSAKGIISNLMK